MEIEEQKYEKIEDINIEYFENYFGNSKDYYMPKLIAFERGKKYSFNLSAFLFGMFWFLYRRLYIHSLIILLVILIESRLERIVITLLGNTKDIELSLRITWLIMFGIVCGYFGNYFYLKQSKKKVEQIIEKTAEESQKMRKLKKAGSGNWIIVLLILVVSILSMVINQK